MAFKMTGMPGIAGVKAEEDFIKNLKPLSGTEKNVPPAEGNKFLMGEEFDEDGAKHIQELIDNGATAKEINAAKANLKKRKKELERKS